jgi:thiol-disulfide isomerase/thioredoxin
MRLLLAAVSSLLALALPAQDGTPHDARLRAGFEAWQAKQKDFSDAAMAARSAGGLAKGAELPAELAEKQRLADAARQALLAEFAPREDLSTASELLIARLCESGRAYLDAVGAYERCLRKGDADAPDLEVLGSLCLAAMNGKDDALAARWMKTLIAEELRRGGGSRNAQVKTSWYPRTLIALGRWDDLATLLEDLADDESPAARAAAATFGVVHAIHVRELGAARARLDSIAADRTRFPDQGAWAALARLALDVHEGRFDEGAAAVRAFLAGTGDGARKPSPVEQNQLRYLAAIEPFLGKPAIELRVDAVVGGGLERSDATLAGLRGKVVVLDFWQPWCEPCRNAMPELVAAQTTHGDRLAVLGVCRIETYGYDVSERKAVRPLGPNDYPAHVADFRADMALNYPLLMATDATNNEAYRVSGIPTLVVIDREGIIRYMSCGAGEPGLFRLALEGVLAHPTMR